MKKLDDLGHLKTLDSLMLYPLNLHPYNQKLFNEIKLSVGNK